MLGEIGIGRPSPALRSGGPHAAITLGATLGAIGILLPLDGRKTSLQLLDGYRGRRWRMGSKL
jgi:hypothetical protein